MIVCNFSSGGANTIPDEDFKKFRSYVLWRAEGMTFMIDLNMLDFSGFTWSNNGTPENRNPATGVNRMASAPHILYQMKLWMCRSKLSWRD